MFLKLLVTKLNDKINFRREVGKNTTVSRLLNDRPEIAEVLNGHGLLKQWLVEQFSGKVTKFPIQWDPKEPEDGDIAEHCHPQRNEPAKVRVSRNMSGLDQLSGVVFELFNIQYHKGHSRLWEKACSGKIGEQEYSHRSYRLEYKAKEKCKRFFKKHSSVFAGADNSNEVYNWIMSPTPFREYYAIIKEEYGDETYFVKVLRKGLRRIREKSGVK